MLKKKKKNEAKKKKDKTSDFSRVLVFPLKKKIKTKKHLNHRPNKTIVAHLLYMRIYLYIKYI